MLVGSCISSKIPVISGVPQGSVLRPTLFLLNDVADIFSDLSVYLSLFADDLKLYTCYKIDALHNDLHTAVNINLQNGLNCGSCKNCNTKVLIVSHL